MSLSPNKLWKFLLFTTLPGLMVAGFFAFANPTHKTIIDPSLPQKTIIDPSLTDRFKDGLVLHQSFDGPHMDWSLTTAEARDASGKGNHGDVVGAVPTIGKVGQALSFDGVDDYVEIPRNVALEPSEVTVSLWFKAHSNTQQVLLEKMDWQIAGYGIWLYPSGERFTINFNIGDTAGWTGGYTYPINEWIFVTITGKVGTDGGKIYVNGEFISAISPTSFDHNLDPIWIGVENASVHFFNGLIDEVRIYNRALTPEEIREHYEAGRARLQL